MEYRQKIMKTKIAAGIGENVAQIIA